MSCIKSIQRGTGDKSNMSFTINEVNPDKCMVLIDSIIDSRMILVYLNSCASTGNKVQNSYGEAYGGATLSSITATSLAFSNVKNTFGWQLIEFA